MSTNSFSPEQQQALLDLAVLGMYADGHLASAEDDRVQRLLITLGHNSEDERNRIYDAAVARVREHSQTTAGANRQASALASQFNSPEHRAQVLKLLDDLLSSDGKVGAQEGTYRAIVREALQKGA